MKDSVGKWYRDKANDLNVIPPHEAWKNVEKTMEDWPKHWYQSNFVGIDKGMDANSWESISEQLNIQRNAKRAHRQFVLRSLSITAAIVLVPLWIANVSDGFVKNFNETGSTQPIVAEQDLNSETNTDATVTTTDNSSNTPSDNSSLAAASTLTNAPNGSGANISLTNPVSMGANPEPNVATILNEPVLAIQESNLPVLFAMNSRKSLGIESFVSRNTSLNIRSVTPFAFTLTEEENKETNKASDVAHNWQIGPTMTFGRSSLINPLSYRDDAMVQKSPHITYGVSATRKFNRNMITTDLLFNDSKSQDIILSSEEVRTQLNFVTLSVQYERVLATAKLTEKLQPELTFGIGAFGSYGTGETVSSNAANSHFTSFTYKKFDFGGVASIGASTQLSDHIRMGLYGRIQSGASNLFEGRAKIPRDMFRTQTFVTSLQAKLSYTF